ncbi:MAG: helix-turn-helix transcriptional regulator [Pseudomonadota bacterium]
MAKTLKDKLADVAPDRRARIEAETDRLHQEYLTLKELRRAKALTQVQLAETLGVKQATVAQMEKRGDLLLSTLRSYVQAMGGRLDLVVEFPDRAPVSIAGLGEADAPVETAEPRPR